MKIATLTSFYQDVLGIKRLLDSLQTPNSPNLNIFVDGKYVGYNSDNDLSNDGSRDVILNSPNTILVDFVGKEVDKRNKYLEICREYDIDVGIIIDSDEYIHPESDWKGFRSDCENMVWDANIWSINKNDLTTGKYCEFPSCWYKPGDVEYYGKHNAFRKIGCNRRSYSKGLISNSVYILHDKSLRNPDRLYRGIKYVNWLSNQEQKLTNV